LMAIQAAIVSAQRCGGLFLAGCLSNHPDVHCPREEPFRRESIWQQKLHMGHAALLGFVLNEPYYAVSMCRLTYDQAFNARVRGYLLKHQVRIVHLVRAAMPTVTSTLLAKLEMARGVPRHRFDDKFADDEVLDVGPDEVIKRIAHLLGQRKRFAEQYADNPQISVQYEELTKWEGHLALNVTRRICRFLEVPTVLLAAHNRKMHRRPIESYYRRWEAIEAAIAERDWGIDLWTS